MLNPRLLPHRRLLSICRSKSLKSWQSYSTKVVPVLSWQKFEDFGDKIAIIDHFGRHSYGSILSKSATLASDIENVFKTHKGDPPKHVAFVCPNDSSFLVMLLACWLSGSTAVPLNKSYPAAQLEYFIKDSCSPLVLSTEHSTFLDEICKRIGVRYETKCTDDISQTPHLDGKDINKVSRTLPAIILYTSGTTGPPKGVVLTHGNLSVQTEVLVDTWEITKHDINLHSLPLHHLHGILNALLTFTSVGGTVHMMPKFDARKVREN